MAAMRMIAAAAVLALTLSGAAEAQSVKAGPLILSGLQLRASPAGVPTAGAYLTIENHGKTADTLLGVRCACANSAMMHRTTTRNGISSMSMVGEVDIPPGGKVEFKPDGLHLMLVGLKRALKAGTTQPMTLRFREAGKVRAPFRVVAVVK
jgi:hypothetical protein